MSQDDDPRGDGPSTLVRSVADDISDEDDRWIVSESIDKYAPSVIAAATINLTWGWTQPLLSRSVPVSGYETNMGILVFVVAIGVAITTATSIRQWDGTAHVVGGAVITIACVVQFGVASNTDLGLWIATVAGFTMTFVGIRVRGSER